MRNIGLLITKNEGPIIKEILDHNIQYINEIYVLDGGDDDTEVILKKYPQISKYIHERDIIDSNIKVKDGIRHYLFQEILKSAEVGDWITIMHGDEMFYHNPNDAINIAEKLNCNLVKWYAAHFFPHKNDLKNWEQLKDKPVYDRFRYYAHYKNKCFIESRQFKIVKGMYYSIDKHSHVIPNSPVPYKAIPYYPVFRHFKLWDLNLNNYDIRHSNKYNKDISKPAGKWSGLHFTVNKWEDFFIEKYPGYPEVSYFDNSFGRLADNFERLNNEIIKNKISMKTRLAIFKIKIFSIIKKIRNI